MAREIFKRARFRAGRKMWLSPSRVKILLSNRPYKHFQRLNLPLRQEPKLGAKEHEMLKARVQVRRHFQCLESSKEAAVNNAVDAKEASENLSTQRGKLGRLKDAQRLFLVIVVGEFGFVIHLIGNPRQDLVNVHGRRDGHGLGTAGIGPSVFHARRKAFSGAKAV